MINIEKIDAVIAATGADYATVRQALLASDGDVAVAIRSIMNDRYHKGQPNTGERTEAPDNGGDNQHQNVESSVDQIIAVIKEIWNTGNASSLIVEKNGKVVLNLSLTVSAFIVIITPLISIIGLGAAILSEYSIKIKMLNGEVIDVLEYSLRGGGSRTTYDEAAHRNTVDNEDDVDDTI